jgi:GNAT superfamily N-acetyltransferase
MQLERFDPASEPGQVRTCHEIYVAGAPADNPHEPPMSFRRFQGWMIHGWTEDPSESWLARDAGGGAAGWFLLTLPRRENRGYGYLRVTVHPARRRAGLGRVLLSHAAARASRAGRSVLSGDTIMGSPGEAFCRAVGARQGLGETTRALRTSELPAERRAQLRAKAAAAAHGYSLEVWEGPVPAGKSAGVVAIVADAEDRPIDPGQEAQAWDEERLRLVDARIAAQGLRFYTVAARHGATGELAGLTSLAVDPADPGWGLQELTAVARRHRGHRLGLLLKVAMMDLLAEREPQVRCILTGNADDNKHMIAINDELGYEAVGRESTWEIDVAAAAALGP